MSSEVPIPAGNPVVVFIGCEHCPQNASQKVPAKQLILMQQQMKDETRFTCTVCHTQWVLDAVRVDTLLSREEDTDKVDVIPKYYPIAPFGKVTVHNIVSRDAVIEQIIAEANGEA